MTQKPPQKNPRETLEMMLGHLGFVFEVHEEPRPMGTTLHVRTRTPSRLIGREGKTLDDLQYLLNRILSRHEEEASRVIVDVENYRTSQQDDLIERIKAFVDRVRQTGAPVELPPLNAFERRIVHTAFKEDPDIETVSPEGPARVKRILVRPKKKSS